MIGSTDDFYSGKMFAVAFSVAPENDDAFAGVIARTPKPITLMTADRFRQTVLLSEKIDRASLAVAVGEDRGLCPLFGRKRVVNLAHFARHVLPAEFIGEMLGQRTVLLVLGFERLDPERLLI